MKKNRLLLLLILSTFLNAQTLTLKQCIHKALDTHPDIKNFALGVEYSTKGVNVARADYLPQVTLNAEYDPIKTYTLPSNGVFHTIESDGWQASATLKQKIWDFSKTLSNIKAKQTVEESSKLTLKDAKALLAYKVKLQYELIVVQKKAVKVREQDLNAKEALYKQAKALVKQGMKTKADESRFLSSLYVAQDNLAIAQANFQKAKSILSLYINSPISDDTAFEQNILDKRDIVVNEQTILQSSPLLQSLQKNIETSELNYKVQKVSRYGSLDAIASYSYQDNLNSYDASLVGVVLNVPLYKGGSISSLQQQALINKQRSFAQYDSKTLILKEEIETLMIDLKRYSQTIKAKEAQLEAAKQTQTVLDARYKEGLATYIELLDATATALDANLGLLQAKYEKSAAMHRVEYLEGKIL